MRLNICETCWNQLHPLDGVTAPFPGVRDTCDFCGNINTDGIYIRKDNSDGETKAQDRKNQESN